MDGVISVVLVDDDPMVRNALELMLGGRDDLVVVGTASNGNEALGLCRQLRPHVVLMDIRMPVLNGLDTTVRLHREHANPPKVIVLTTFDTDEHVVRAVAAGAEGFLLKDTPPGEIIDAIRRVADGEAMLSPSATRSLVSQIRADAAAGRSEGALQRLSRLTHREHEVALCVGRGMSNADIAHELYLSVPTVKAHVSRLLEKLEATNRVQIAICVHDAGLL